LLTYGDIKSDDYRGKLTIFVRTINVLITYEPFRTISCVLH